MRGAAAPADVGLVPVPPLPVVLARLLGSAGTDPSRTLERLRDLSNALGRPHLTLPPVIHVAGTNGKGSTVAFLKAICQSAGLAAHVYTSPHLVRWNERFQMGGATGARIVSDEKLAQTLHHVMEADETGAASIFGKLTLAAFLLFSDHPADVAIVETGLGGRRDATNLIETPAASVITSISYDHQAALGDRIDQIAREKAGIIKPGRPVVVGRQEYKEALDVIRSEAAGLGSPVFAHGDDFGARMIGDTLRYEDTEITLELEAPKLCGCHQVENAASAIKAARLAGVPRLDQAAQRAMRAVDWPGRLQKVRPDGFSGRAPPSAEIWLDGGHNPSAGQRISEYFRSGADADRHTFHLITGMNRDKDAAGYLRNFAKLAAHIYTVPLRTSAHMYLPRELAEIASSLGFAATPVPDVISALQAITLAAGESARAPRVLIAGSLYLVGDVLESFPAAGRWPEV
ncbi:MAG: bifunctional folylpolyglutamate synthase/dihydrofolate synthase [Hyphomonas sp.]|uniref:bifunctional folylpolyglutamate synthase/dihydrofolate synthase n=1 Tax=Hyphomonas sp. TaxID=87 RepID=UPI0017EB66CF|nr:folylpolyglutamate synthase/dihydrofolate synthase family protein [Hyphomonas sp.]MBA3066949.1 bifunctional folylpolyglutamate synthase/dihydrofolate synthase [Hyphomonas sp.]MBU4060547.1 bifunctional folylpolyglutamate synthase/dihydrofolate synthase [Alphaproteobacteria bacterium]